MIMALVNSHASYTDIPNLASYRTSSILIFLICIREAAVRKLQAFSSQSLSFIDSQGNSHPQRQLSSIEFTANIVNPSAGDSGTDAFSDLEDDPRGEDDASEAENDGIELEEYIASVHSVDARTSRST